MSARPRPRYPLRREIVPLASLFVLAWALAALFPREVFRADWRGLSEPPGSSRAPVGCALVTLSPAEEAAALATARTSWQGKAATETHRLDMLPPELPESPFAPVLDLSARPPASVGFRAGPRVTVLPPTAAAPRPAPLGRARADAPRPAFPRELLLQLH